MSDLKENLRTLTDNYHTAQQAQVLAYRDKLEAEVLIHYDKVLDYVKGKLQNSAAYGSYSKSVKLNDYLVAYAKTEVPGDDGICFKHYMTQILVRRLKEEGLDVTLDYYGNLEISWANDNPDADACC